MISIPEKLDTIELIIDKCDQIGVAALKEELIKYMWENWHVTRSTAENYLKMLESKPSIYIEGNEVWTIKRWRKIEKARALDYNKMVDVINGQS